MRVHANAKLGPAGRLALVELIEGGCSLRTRGRSEFCFGRHRASVVASLARRRHVAARERRLVAGPIKSPAPPATTHRHRARGADLRGPPGDGLGAEIDRWSDRPAARDGLAGAVASWDLSPSAERARGAQPLRVALPR